AGEKNAERHIGDTAALDSGPEGGSDRFRPFAFGEHAIPRLHRAAPVNFFAPGAIWLDGQERRGREFLHAVEDRARRRHGAVKAEIVVKRYRVDAGVDSAGREQRGQGRREAKTSATFRIVKRFDAEPVARENHAPAFALG